ncbi:SETMR methyltransferase, partial [Acromyrmex heyeri]
MEKNEFSAVMKHLHMKGLTPKEIKAKLDVYSTSASAFATVYNWVNEFKRGCTSTCDVPHSGRPIEAATSEIIDKVHDIVLTDRRMKVRELINFCVEEGEDRKIGRKGSDHSFSGCTRYNSYRLPSDEANDQWRLKNVPIWRRRKMLFHQDNARVHTCPASMAIFNEFRYELLPHPAYSPDLAPCDYFLFPNLKK